MGPSEPQIAARIRREPPRFRHLQVRRVEPVSPHMAGVTLGGPELDGFAVDDPPASVRLLLPSPGDAALVMPEWNGNEFLLPGGERPIIRTFTPYRVDPANLELDLWIVVHDGGAASDWVATARSGDAVAVSGPGRGYTVDRAAPAYLVAGDETAIPAIRQLLGLLPGEIQVTVLIEVARPDARLALPEHPNVTVSWFDLPPGARPGDALVAAVEAAAVNPEGRVWAAGEAAAVQRIRRHLFEDRGVTRARATVRGYWKHGRRGDDGE